MNTNQIVVDPLGDALPEIRRNHTDGAWLNANREWLHGLMNHASLHPHCVPSFVSAAELVMPHFLNRPARDRWIPLLRRTISMTLEAKDKTGNALLLMQMGTIDAITERPKAAVVAAAQASELVLDASDSRGRLEIYRNLLYISAFHWSETPEQLLLKNIRQELKHEADDSYQRALAYQIMATYHQTRADDCNTLRYAGRAYDIWERVLHRAKHSRDFLQAQRGKCLLMIGIAHRGMGQPEKALGYLNEALVDLDVAAHKHNYVICAWQIGEVEKDRGNYERALELSQYALEHFKEFDYQTHVGLVLYGIGVTLTRKGNPEEALGFLEDAQKHWEQLKHKYYEAHAVCDMARAYIPLGDYADAVNCLERVEAMIASMGIDTEREELLEKAEETWEALLASGYDPD